MGSKMGVKRVFRVGAVAIYVPVMAISLQIAKKMLKIRIKFQHNMALIFQLLLWYDKDAECGTGQPVFWVMFSRFPSKLI